METLQLNNGNRIDAVGTGTNSFGKEGGRFDGALTNDTHELMNAFELGYRFIDTAESYRNEEMVGLALKQSSLPRSAFFVETKMMTRGYEKIGREETIAAIERSLKKLQTDYIDCYLIHMPWDNKEEFPIVWNVLEEYCEKGVLRNIGVSNFMPEHLQIILDNCRIKPVVNQIVIQPGNKNEEARRFSLENGVRPMAWGPLRFDAQYRAPLEEIGRNYGKSWAQVILRYHYQKGTITIPKSHDAEHQAQNIEIFDFCLNEEEMTLIDRM